MKYSIVTFGCRVNQADSLEIEEQLLAAGGCPSSPGCADVVMVNTCSVTAASDQGARQTIRRIARQNPAAQIVVTGCYATREPTDLCRLPGVVEVVPNEQKQRVASVALWHGRGGRSEDPSAEVTTAERFGAGEGTCGAAIEPGLAGRTAFTLRIQTGCDEPCTYCIIPATRGRGRSRPVDAVLAEVDRIVRAGFKEIALTGVHLGSYGRDLAGSDALDLAGLLRRLDSRFRDVRFRISSLEPMDCTPAVVDVVAESDRFAEHFHLPLQHASDGILRAMRRPYTLDGYRRLVDGIRDRVPHAAIGSDIIVGFPGETDRDVELLVRYLTDSPLTHLHVFPYSDRPGTAAAALPDKVPGAQVRARADRVRCIGSALSSRFRQRQLGTVHRGLTIDDGSVAVTGNYLKVRIPPGRKRNEWAIVRVTEAGETMTGSLLASVLPIVVPATSACLPR
jgi:threonylcarbamoyladenosine tRNA methylthiotransferase MtaB